MKAFLKNGASLFFVLFISASASAYPGNDLRPGKVKREIKQECRKQKGACNSYRVKDFKKPDKFRTNRNRISRANR